jgi:hypothetical protein
MKHLNIAWSDLLIMPTFERRFYVDFLAEEFAKKREAIEKQNNQRK